MFLSITAAIVGLLAVRWAINADSDRQSPAPRPAPVDPPSGSLVIRHPSHAATRAYLAAHPLPGQQDGGRS
ncbi:hypothetical protein [Streptomyces sp. CB03234]|uniref:hypothetical protein n=1 Tax=Streptomyces sp. (strain CB03234) TaxID=1703937 RepID=UPI00117E1915|nr:hypothetical protein [Streptomyces sp. CB03234]